MNVRINKINELISHQLGQLITKEVEFPSDLLVTITRVQTTPDLKAAKVFFTVLPENMQGTALKILVNSARNLSRELSHVLKTKFTPRLSFSIDEQEIFAGKVEKILDEINKK